MTIDSLVPVVGPYRIVRRLVHGVPSGVVVGYLASICRWCYLVVRCHVHTGGAVVVALVIYVIMILCTICRCWCVVCITV